MGRVPAPLQRLIPLAERAEWTRALDGVPHAFGHTWEACYALQLTTGDRTFLYAFEQGPVRIVCPIIERSFRGRIDVATPPGFSGITGTGTPDLFMEHWTAFARARGWVCAYIALHPILPTPVEFPTAERHNSAYGLDLTRDLEVLRAGFDRNRRREIQAWETEGGVLLHERERLRAFLEAEHARFQARVRAPASYTRSVETLRFLCGMDDILLVGRETADRVSEVYVFAHTAFIGTCLHYISLPDTRAGGTALLWHGIRALKDRGVPWLNLGGGVREDDSIARAKQRFRSRRFPLRALKRVFLPADYRGLCRETGVDPASTGYFPAYREPDLRLDRSDERSHDSDGNDA